MTMLELKQHISWLTEPERRELHAFLIRLRHEKPSWRRMIGRRMKAMDEGKKHGASAAQAASP